MKIIIQPSFQPSIFEMIINSGSNSNYFSPFAWILIFWKETLQITIFKVLMENKQQQVIDQLWWCTVTIFCCAVEDQNSLFGFGPHFELWRVFLKTQEFASKVLHHKPPSEQLRLRSSYGKARTISGKFSDIVLRSSSPMIRRPFPTRSCIRFLYQDSVSQYYTYIYYWCFCMN